VQKEQAGGNDTDARDKNIRNNNSEFSAEPSLEEVIFLARRSNIPR
jgi:hypothetical protein